jgi:protein XagA
MRATIILTITAFKAFIFVDNFAQPLTKGNYQVRVSQQYTASNSFFDSDEESIKIRTNSISSTNFSFNYAVTDRLAICTTFPVFVRSIVNGIQYNQSGTTEPGLSLNSLGDAEVGLIINLFKRLPFQTVGFVTVGLPFGKKGNVGLDTDLQTGDGELNQLIGVKIQKNFSSLFLNGYTSFNNRSKDFSNEIRYGFEAGYLGNKFNIIARFNAIESLFDKTAPVSQNGIFSNHRELVSPGVEVLYKITTHIGIFGSSDFVLTGRNTLKAPIFCFGIQLRKK